MRPLRLTVLLGVVTAAIVVASAGASGQNATAPPVAHASGGDVVVSILPSIVNTRLVRAQRLLDSAAGYQDLGDDANAVKALAAGRANLTKSWTGDKFYIENAPPPVVAADSTYVAPQAKATAKTKAKAPARASGAPVGASTSPYADIYATTAAVLTLQHNFATTALGLLDTASATVLPALNSTIFAALNNRDAAIAYIHTLPVPPAPADFKLAPAHASGAPVATSGWSTTMQPILFDIDDEQMLIDGLRAAANVSATRARLLDLVEVQITKTSRKVNLYWPPLPAAD